MLLLNYVCIFIYVISCKWKVRWKFNCKYFIFWNSIEWKTQHFRNILTFIKFNSPVNGYQNNFRLICVKAFHGKSGKLLENCIVLPPTLTIICVNPSSANRLVQVASLWKTIKFSLFGLMKNHIFIFFIFLG
jgi:hypothetical protein